MAEHKFDVWRKKPSMLNTHGEFICKMHTEDPNVILYAQETWILRCRAGDVPAGGGQGTMPTHKNRRRDIC